MNDLFSLRVLYSGLHHFAVIADLCTKTLTTNIRNLRISSSPKSGGDLIPLEVLIFPLNNGCFFILKVK